MSEVSEGTVRAAFAARYPNAVYEDNPTRAIMIRKVIQAAKDHNDDWQDPATIIATYELVREIHERLTKKRFMFDYQFSSGGVEYIGDMKIRPELDPPWLTNGLMSPQDEVNAARTWWRNQREAES